MFLAARSVDLVDLGPVAAAAAAAARWHLRVERLHRGRARRLELLALRLELLGLRHRVGVEPAERAGHRLLGRLLVGRRDLLVVERVLHRVGVVLEAVARLRLGAEGGVLLRVLLGVGAMPLIVNSPSLWLSLVRERSPSYTWMVTAVWLSAAVEKVWLLRLGPVVPRGMSEVMTS